jgi:hypothetical protein
MAARQPQGPQFRSPAQFYAFSYVRNMELFITIKSQTILNW